MRLKDIMTTHIRVVAPETTVRDAAQKMDEDNVGALPVCDGNQLIGIVTDRDIVVRSTTADQRPSEVLVRDVMTAPVTYGLEDQTIEEAAAILKQSAIKRLPVLDADHRLIGMVSIDDLLLELPRDAMAATAAFHAVADIERPGL